MMFGEVEVQRRPEDLVHEDRVVLSVRNLTMGKKVKDVSFDLYKGEVLGIAGMLGSGRTELLRAIFGIDKYDEGEIIFDGKAVKRPTPQKMKEMGMGLTLKTESMRD